MENFGRSLPKMFRFAGYSSSARGSAGYLTERQKRIGSRKQEKLWENLFANPSKWWDNRLEKPHARFPDFKHKQTGEGLWLIDGRNPTWVTSEIAFIEPGVSVLSLPQRLNRYNKTGQYEKTLDLFKQVRREGVISDGYVFFHALKACAALQRLEVGRRIHKQILATRCELDLYVGSSLVDMYAKCRSIDEAWEVFNEMPARNAISFNVMILGYVKSGEPGKALELYQKMQREGIAPDTATYVGLFNACASMQELELGRRHHEEFISSCLEPDIHVPSSLIDMYAKCGSIDEAWAVFSEMSTHNVVTWSAMILGLVKCKQGQKALDLFQKMQEKGIEPDSVTFVGLLNACTSIGALEEGRRVHEQIILSGCESNLYVGSSLITMYGKCGSIEDAWRVLNKMPVRNVVVWNAMISACVKSGQAEKAAELFKEMQEKGFKPNPVTFVGFLNSCAIRSSVAALEEGRLVHDQIISSGCESNMYVRSSLVDMYAKCGSINEAWNVFSKISLSDVVGWNAMILGLVKCGQGQKALELFQQMLDKGVQPNSVTFVGSLNACASIAALEKGRKIHQQIVLRGSEFDGCVGSSLVDMYSKCGSIKEARVVFNRLPTRDVVGWTAMIMGYAMHGLAKEAVAVFEDMAISGVEIDEVTFTCLLSACSHGGLVKEGMEYFECMRPVYGVSPKEEHFTCMVDVLGRAGHLEDAEKLVNTMPFEPCAATWLALLGACRIHGNIEMGERASKKVVELDPTNASGYVLLSNMYAAAGHWENMAIVQEQRFRNYVIKEPGRTWIEVNNEIHSFVVNDRKHPQILEIDQELSRLSQLMKEAGYFPDMRFALQDTEEEKNEQNLIRHSEKLAIAYGLISSPTRAPIRIVKSLRVCGDCHTATKFISRIEGRVITVRDGNRFHHFENGLCSCGDYW